MNVTELRRRRPRVARDARLRRTIQALRELDGGRGHGRAWINGREVGGTDSRYAHLHASHD